MSKRKTEINITIADYVKTIRKNEGLTQKEFGEKIGLTQQSINRIEKGKQPLLNDIIDKIVKEFPLYRKEALLGIDDFLTYDMWAEEYYKIKDIIADSMWAIIEKSLKSKNKHLCFVHREGVHIDSTERLKADCYYTITDNKGIVLKKLSASEMVKFEEKIQDYCDFLTEKYL